MEAFSIASAAVSVILGAYAIWLSVVFYRMSTESSNKIQESAKDLSASVAKLEKLFDHLYSDTFSMMRDTYSDMRKHVWPEVIDQAPEIANQIEARADDKIDAIREEIKAQIEIIAEQVGGAEAKTDLLREELSPLFEQVIERSRSAEAEAQEENVRDALLNLIREAGPQGIAAAELLSKALNKIPGVGPLFGTELRKLRDQGIISYDNVAGDGYPEKGSDRVIYIPARRRKA